MRRQLTDTETTLIEAALTIARDKYRENAANASELTGAAWLAEQFTQQAVDAEALRILFADLPTVTIDTGETEA